jgi:geranylgeranyl pyrophosphate synthase
VAHLDALAADWGLAYQIVDDAKDALLSGLEAGKTTRRDLALGRPNLPVLVGWDGALERLAALLVAAHGELAALRRDGLRWRGLARLQSHLEREAAGVRERASALAACA